MDIIRENNVTIPKYNNVKLNEDIFDSVTSVHLPPGLFEESAVTGG